MPKDIIAMKTTTNWDGLLDAVEAARATNQTAEDTWCVVGVNGAHILTIWSQPHTSEDKWVRPSRHAEERLVTIHAERFESGYRAMAGSSNIVTIFLKKSPCNYGTGSCFDMFRTFLLHYRSDHSSANAVEVIYDKVYGGPNGMYKDSSLEAIDEFGKARNCSMVSWYRWYQDQVESQQDMPDPTPTTHIKQPTAPKPINLPSRKAEQEAGIKPVERKFVSLGSIPKPVDDGSWG
ncbi:MAG TPA: hypothetical protein VKR06_28010 [Ktedonosporobacter sp.]|nr:hypothetical protein [Ktedonosporobacter sp.]